MKILKLLPVLAMTVAVISCSTVKVVTDVDKTTDFSQYKTYSFLGWQNNSDRILTDFDKKRMRDAFISEFERRGLEPVADNGDMQVSLFVVVDQKTSVSAYTDFYGGRYGVYHRYGYGWGYGYANTTYNQHDYLEGTLVMDVFDGKSKDQIWQGIVTKTVNEIPEKRANTIPTSIQSLMRKFPVHPK